MKFSWLNSGLKQKIAEITILIKSASADERFIFMAFRGEFTDLIRLR